MITEYHKIKIESNKVIQELKDITQGDILDDNTLLAIGYKAAVLTPKFSATYKLKASATVSSSEIKIEVVFENRSDKSSAKDRTIKIWKLTDSEKNDVNAFLNGLDKNKELHELTLDIPHSSSI